MESDIFYLTEIELDKLICNSVNNWHQLGLKFLGWRIPYKMQIVDKQKWMLAKIKYEI